MIVNPSCDCKRASIVVHHGRENSTTNPLELSTELDEPLVDSSLANRVCRETETFSFCCKIWEVRAEAYKFQRKERRVPAQGLNRCQYFRGRTRQ